MSTPTMLLLSLLVTMLLTGSARAYDNDRTHVILTELATNFQLTLQQQLAKFPFKALTPTTTLCIDPAFLAGVVPADEFVRFSSMQTKPLKISTSGHNAGKYEATIRNLLLAGAEAEDLPHVRARHHFHTPTYIGAPEPGLNNPSVVEWGANLYAVVWDWEYISAALSELQNDSRVYFDLTGQSAKDRALGDNPVAHYGPPYNYWDLYNAKRYFYLALTGEDEAHRSHYLALTFIALGHVMHLLQDMAVPAHTRNDFLGDHVFQILERSIPRSEATCYEDFVQNDFSWSNLTEASVVKLTASDFASTGSLWDEGSAALGKGLSEYTSANFFSKGSFRQESYQQITFPLPILDNKEYFLQLVKRPADLLYHFRYYFKATTRGGEEIKHLAVSSYAYNYMETIDDVKKEKMKKAAYLDPNCYADYSPILLAKAVSYSAALLEKFFTSGILTADLNADGSLTIHNASSKRLDGNFTLYNGDGSVRNQAHDRVTKLPVTWRLNIDAQGSAVTPPTYLPNRPLNTPDRQVATEFSQNTSENCILIFQGSMDQESDSLIVNSVELKPYLYSVTTSYYPTYADFRLSTTYTPSGTIKSLHGELRNSHLLSPLNVFQFFTSRPGLGQRNIGLFADQTSRVVQTVLGVDLLSETPYGYYYQPLSMSVSVSNTALIGNYSIGGWAMGQYYYLHYFAPACVYGSPPAYDLIMDNGHVDQTDDSKWEPVYINEDVSGGWTPSSLISFPFSSMLLSPASGESVYLATVPYDSYFSDWSWTSSNVNGAVFNTCGGNCEQWNQQFGHCESSTQFVAFPWQPAAVNYFIKLLDADGGYRPAFWLYGVNAPVNYQ